MFCTNCGSKLPDGSNFCSVCGARIAGLEAPEPFNNNQPDDDMKKTTSVSFDWSNVKDEPHRKAAPKVHSPWGTTELSKKDFFDSDDYAPNEEYSRTMSFIDLLKKERDERAQAAAEEARQFTEKEETPYDYSAFEDAPSYYVPPLYDVEDDTDLIQDRTPRYGKHSKPEPEDDYDGSEDKLDVSSLVESEIEDEEENFDIFDTSDISDFSDTLSDVLDEIEIPSAVDGEDNTDKFEDTVVLKSSEIEEALELEIPEEPTILEESVIPEKPVAPEEPAIPEEPEIPEIAEEPEIAEALKAFRAFDELEAYDTLATPEEDFDIPEYIDLEKPFEEEIAAHAQEELKEQEEPKEVKFEELDELEYLEEEPKLENKNLDSEIEDILAVGSGKSTEDKEIDLFEEIVEPEPEPVAEPEPIPEAEIELEPELPLVDEPEEEEKPLIELVQEEVEPISAESGTVDLNAFFEPELIEEPAEEPVVELPEIPEEEVADEEAEMENLKNRLTDLMGYSPSEEEVAEATEELLIQEITDEDEADEEEIELELGNEESDAISVDEIEKELFGETTDEDIEAEATKKIDKFYTLYKKNEEFQKLLDEEYNKLKTEDGVPHVDELLAEETKPEVEKFEDEPDTEEKPATPEAQEIKEEPKKEEPEKEETSKKEKKSLPKIKLPEKKDVEGEDVAAGGNKLTIVAVILAALLVIVLAMIIVMYVAPYSALAIKIDSIIQTISSLFSSVDAVGTYWLL